MYFCMYVFRLIFIEFFIRSLIMSGLSSFPYLFSVSFLYFCI